jgi:hypothetical protein
MQDIAGAQILCFGSSLGVTPEVTATVAVGCTYTRTGAGAYTILFDSIPPGPTVPSVNDVVVCCQLLALDGAVTNVVVTKTTSASGCTGFTAAVTGAADAAFNWVVFRKPQG